MQDVSIAYDLTEHKPIRALEKKTLYAKVAVIGNGQLQQCASESLPQMCYDDAYIMTLL